MEVKIWLQQVNAKPIFFVMLLSLIKSKCVYQIDISGHRHIQWNIIAQIHFLTLRKHAGLIFKGLILHEHEALNWHFSGKWTFLHTVCLRALAQNLAYILDEQPWHLHLILICYFAGIYMVILEAPLKCTLNVLQLHSLPPTFCHDVAGAVKI